METDPAKQTHTVYCHVCKHGEDRIPRNRARLIGSPSFGGLWHCEKHEDATCGCPRGSWTEDRKWWLKKPVRDCPNCGSEATVEVAMFLNKDGTVPETNTWVAFCKGCAPDVSGPSVREIPVG